ncbi:serine dehydratase beta chain [Microbacterium trichothecenolyticum]|uniref:serine dehydratase beta chain n=1 Tax=Microbacterium trichothecenolyticum TaxID=69370 RepID=UPI0035BE15C7
MGIGPSSSHTVGPMRAANDFAGEAAGCKDLTRTVVTLYGSPASTAATPSTPWRCRSPRLRR